MLFLQTNFFLQLHTATFDPSSPRSIPPSCFVMVLEVMSFAHVAVTNKLRFSVTVLFNFTIHSILNCCSFFKRA